MIIILKYWLYSPQPQHIKTHSGCMQIHKHSHSYAVTRPCHKTCPKVCCGRTCFVVKKERNKRKKKESKERNRTARRRHRGALLMSLTRWMSTQYWFCATSHPPPIVAPAYYSPRFPFLSHFPLHFNANLGEANKLMSCHI